MGPQGVYGKGGEMRFQSHWRKEAAEVISEVLDQCDWSTPEREKATRARLREVYPYGERAHYSIALQNVESRRVSR